MRLEFCECSNKSSLSRRCRFVFSFMENNSDSPITVSGLSEKSNRKTCQFSNIKRNTLPPETKKKVNKHLVILVGYVCITYSYVVIYQKKLIPQACLFHVLLQVIAIP